MPLKLKLDNSGQYTRQIGWLTRRSGQKKFRLGSDAAKAEIAYLRLGILWDLVKNEHAHQRQLLAKSFDPDTSTPDHDDGPRWTEVTLTLAEAIRKHQHSIKVGSPSNIEDAAAYAAYLDHLRHRFGEVIQILPADEEAAEKGRQAHRNFAEHRSRQARLNARIASIPIPQGVVGETLYQAIDAYADHVTATNRKESGKVEAANARRLKNSIEDMDLGTLGVSALERVAGYWAARPEAKLRGGKTTGRRISVTTVDNHLSTARRFIRWLDRCESFNWEMPRHALDALKVNLQRLRTSEEIAGLRKGVAVLSVQQLTDVYRVATDFERLLMLLGLNAAMAQAEIVTLRWDEIDGQTIKRVRQKSSVYAESALWPETRLALDWWRRVRSSGNDLVMLTNEGRPYTRQRISNAWKSLERRLERRTSTSVDWWLPFKHLRKTAAQLVRSASDGEIAGICLSHGNPVATDVLADVYSNRPFHKVADALTTVRQQLQPMFNAAPDAFQSSKIGR